MSDGHIAASKARALQHAGQTLAPSSDVTAWASFMLVGLPR